MKVSRRAHYILLACAAATLLASCSSINYYAQAAQGQLSLLGDARPIEEWLSDHNTEPKLKLRLATARQIRTFAVHELALPDNKSYRNYASLARPFVLWNVVATPELSLRPVQWCFPVAGCVSYKGYYSKDAANSFADTLRAQGHDVQVGGVPAYSTLGWFNDPIISSMMNWGDERLATLIFHELAHQRLYVKDDTEFNESFATFVEQEGTRQWRALRRLPPDNGAQARQRDQFIELVLATRSRLEQLYALPLPPDQMRQRKAAEFERLRAQYRSVRDSQWAGDKRYDAWFNAPLNNARLLPFGLYDQWVPAFEALFRQAHGDWPAFYAAAEKLGALPVAERKAALKVLAGP